MAPSAKPPNTVNTAGSDSRPTISAAMPSPFFGAAGTGAPYPG